MADKEIGLSKTRINRVFRITCVLECYRDRKWPKTPVFRSEDMSSGELSGNFRILCSAMKGMNSE